MSGGAERGKMVRSAAPEREIPRMIRDQGPPDGHRVPRGGTQPATVAVKYLKVWSYK
jgi:hypothetical protein